MRLLQLIRELYAKYELHREDTAAEWRATCFRRPMVAYYKTQSMSWIKRKIYFWYVGR